MGEDHLKYGEETHSLINFGAEECETMLHVINYTSCKIKKPTTKTTTTTTNMQIWLARGVQGVRRIINPDDDNHFRKVVSNPARRLSELMIFCSCRSRRNNNNNNKNNNKVCFSPSIFGKWAAIAWHAIHESS